MYVCEREGLLLLCVHELKKRTAHEIRLRKLNAKALRPVAPCVSLCVCVSVNISDVIVLASTNTHIHTG